MKVWRPVGGTAGWLQVECQWRPRGVQRRFNRHICRAISPFRRQFRQSIRNFLHFFYKSIVRNIHADTPLKCQSEIPRPTNRNRPLKIGQSANAIVLFVWQHLSAVLINQSNGFVEITDLIQQKDAYKMTSIKFD